MRTSTITGNPNSRNIWIVLSMLFLMVSGMCLRSESSDIEIQGNLRLPKQWTVFATIDRNAPIPDASVLSAVPDVLSLGETVLKARTVTITDPFGRLDFVPLFGGGRWRDAHVNKTAYVYIPFSVAKAGPYTFGMGADWWLQAWLDGEEILNTLKNGNDEPLPSALDHMTTIEMTAGAHVLVVRFISGAGSSVLAVGGPAVLRKGTPTIFFPNSPGKPMPKGNIIPRSDFEKTVYEKHYRKNIEKNYVQFYSWASYGRIQENPTSRKYEIDPAEFSRDLSAKETALQTLLQRRIAKYRNRSIKARYRTNIEQYIAKLDDPNYYRKLHHHRELAAAAHVCMNELPYREDLPLRLTLYQRIATSLQQVMDAPSFPVSCFNIPRATAPLYFTLADRLAVDKEDDLLGPAATRVEALCRDVVYLTWIFPYNHNSSMRRKNPYSVNTFRYSSAYTVGNFGYRSVVDCALIHRDTKMLDIVRQVILHSLHNRTSYNTHSDTFWFNQGLLSDGTGMAHGRQSYAFGYVGHYVERGAFRNADMLKGTPWEIGPEHWDLIADFLLEGQQWTVYRGLIDYSVNGRHNLYAPEQNSYIHKGHKVLLRFSKQLLELSKGTVERKAEIEAMRTRIEKKEDLEGNRFFWGTEDLVHRRKNFYFLANLSSVRVAGPENARPWAEQNFYFGDGATMILSLGNEYNIARGAWNTSALPGITAPDHPVPYRKTWIGFYGQNIYSGGVSDGRNGAAAFRYVKDGVKVTANKAYFACDYTVAALGYITGNDAESPVLTTLNQTQWNTDVTALVNGRERRIAMTEPCVETFRNDTPMAFWQDRIGYAVLPAGETEVLLKAETRRTDWGALAQIQKDVPDQDVGIFQLSVSHGDRESFAKQTEARRRYQYLLRAEVDCRDFLDILERKPVAILANSAEIQAVHFREKGILQAVFYVPATLATGHYDLTVDKPAIVMIAERPENRLAITVADPLQSPMTDTLELTFNTDISGSGVVRGDGQSVLSIEMPEKPFIGQSITLFVDSDSRVRPEWH